MHSKVQKSQVSKVLLEIQPMAFAVSAIRVAKTIIFEMYVTVSDVILSFASFVELSDYYFHLNWLWMYTLVECPFWAPFFIIPPCLTYIVSMAVAATMLGMLHTLLLLHF